MDLVLSSIGTAFATHSKSCAKLSAIPSSTKWYDVPGKQILCHCGDPTDAHRADLGADRFDHTQTHKQKDRRIRIFFVALAQALLP